MKYDREDQDLIMNALCNFQEAFYPELPLLEMLGEVLILLSNYDFEGEE